MIRHLLPCIFLLAGLQSTAQLKWVPDTTGGGGIEVYKTITPLDGKPNIAWYVSARLKDKRLVFDVDTTFGRRMTPSAFYEKNDRPAIVVNCSFFSFATHQNLNAVMKNGRQVGFNVHSIAARGRDTLTYRHTAGSAIGISKKRKADVAWLYTDSTERYPLAIQEPMPFFRDSSALFSRRQFKSMYPGAKKWKMKTAVGGGPVLVQDGQVRVSNEEEWKFPGKALQDKHPRTAMGYTADGRLIILVVEGRNPGVAEGATLGQLAGMLKALGCTEALNLDGGGSSCLLVDGRETIRPSDKGKQREIPAVFTIYRK